MPAARPWLRTSEAAARLHVQPRTVTRWAREGRLEHRRTLGGHRRYDPELIDALVQALIHRPNPPPRPTSHHPGKEPCMARSMVWQIDMGDGTWSACCTGCRLPLGRGPRAAVARLAGAHVCEPLVPLGRRRRRPA